MSYLRTVIVMPAYNAAHTLYKTFNALPDMYKKHVLLVDDCSNDSTVETARSLGIHVIVHEHNTGYGGNQKTCYKEALKMGADIVVMLHPDYQYPPELIPAMVAMIEYGGYDVCLGSRILCGEARSGHMPKIKYIANRILTFVENILTGAKLSEYHTGYRAYTRNVLEKIDFEQNSDNFIFDNQLLLQVMARNFRIGEISSPCRYFAEASSINLTNSSIYGLQCLWWGTQYFLGRHNISKHPLLFSKTNDKRKWSLFNSSRNILSKTPVLRSQRGDSRRLVGTMPSGAVQAKHGVEIYETEQTPTSPKDELNRRPK